MTHDEQIHYCWLMFARCMVASRGFYHHPKWDVVAHAIGDYLAKNEHLLREILEMPSE